MQYSAIIIAFAAAAFAMPKGLMAGSQGSCNVNSVVSCCDTTQAITGNSNSAAAVPSTSQPLATPARLAQPSAARPLRSVSSTPTLAAPQLRPHKCLPNKQRPIRRATCYQQRAFTRTPGPGMKQWNQTLEEGVVIGFMYQDSRALERHSFSTI
ncbi:hypothetical protein HII31_06716 [Pseudocercospora fuligena]|uniref:Hydrophobin n=1 Tax=Pseudocercospora fuligena TaxID=685502 RepID=A0A8H6RJA5_9PEZI|nr:hypothetical protein HII31_06716 [Pseudocercospora fuligena]